MSEITQAIGREGRQLMDQLPDVGETLGSMETQLRELDTRARALIQERPLMALAAAVAAGYLLRRLLPFGK